MNKECFLEVKKVCEALKELMKEELEEREYYGINLGISQGEKLKLMKQIQKKLIKEKDLRQIADELEENQ